MVEEGTTARKKHGEKENQGKEEGQSIIIPACKTVTRLVSETL